MPKKRIPIAAAKRIASDHGMDQVILLAWSRETGDTHVVTYGRTLQDCVQAADGGNRLKRELGWPEELCNAQPSRAPGTTRGGAPESR